MTTRIVITGIWHQGAVLAAAFAELGNDVYGVCAPDTAAELNAARPLVHEAGLDELLARNVAAGRLRFGPDVAAALADAEFAFVSADTPVGPDDAPDLEPVVQLARELRDAATRKLVLVVTAQVPIGTTHRLAAIVSESGFAASPSYVPEFLRLGTAVTSFVHADRFVIGADDEEVASRVGALFAPLGRPTITMGVRSAELAKHAANAFLATSISFINEIADVAAHVDADVTDVVAALKLDKRIGPHAFLQPGLGFGGGTLARELRALQQLGAEHGVETTLVDAVLTVNARRATLVYETLADALGGLAGTRIALMGLAYKGGTNTLRRTIAEAIVAELVRSGANVTAYDPLVSPADAAAIGVDVSRDLYAAASGSDAVAVLTDADAALDLGRLRDAMRGDVVLDARTILDPAAVRAAGLRYVRLGASRG